MIQQYTDSSYPTQLRQEQAVELRESPPNTITHTTRLDVEDQKRRRAFAAASPAQPPANARITGAHDRRAVVLRRRAAKRGHALAGVVQRAEVRRGRQEAAVRERDAGWGAWGGGAGVAGRAGGRGGAREAGVLGWWGERAERGGGAVSIRGGRTAGERGKRALEVGGGGRRVPGSVG